MDKEKEKEGEGKLAGEIMPNEGNNFLGAMQSASAVRGSSDNDQIPQNSNYQQNSFFSSYLILSPTNPLRTSAISILTHWIYTVVIVVTICAFVISSASCDYWCADVVKTDLGAGENRTLVAEKNFPVLIWTRRVLLAVLLLEMSIKSIARGFLVEKLSYLRLTWDWLDVISLAILFVSLIIPWKEVESFAAGIALLKLIPLHSGSINAFTSLCSCAKKLIPVLVYGLIILWMYGVVIFTLFVKYHQDVGENGDPTRVDTVAETNGSASDSVENENITPKSHVAAFVDGDYLTRSTSKKSQNFSFGLSVECLPTNLRSLSGSLIQASQMLTLGFSHSNLASTLTRGNISSNLNKLGSQCQYEMYTLSIVETLVIISGTLPIIAMTFGALYNFFQKEIKQFNSFYHPDDNEAEQESQTSYQYLQRRRLGSGISGRSNNSHAQNSRDDGPSSLCLRNSFTQLANIFCDWDYYFCCLASLQRRLNPCSTQLLNSKKFKVYVMLIVSLDFLCMTMLLWFFNNEEEIRFSPKWIIKCCIQICFILYTLEAVFKWFFVSSDEYWTNVWSAFDLTLVIVYWIGFTVMHVWSYHPYYVQFCGILMIRMLKVVPYWKSLQQSLKVMTSSMLVKLHYLFVILICSCTTLLLKNAVCMSGAETQGSALLFSSWSDMSANTVYILRVLAKYFFYIILSFQCSVVIICVFIETVKVLRYPQGKPVNASISFLLNDSHSEELVNMQYHQPRRSLNASASPISIMSFTNGISPMKYSLTTATPSESNNGILSHETQSILTPSSELLSPLLPIPTSNGLNGHIHSPYQDNCHLPDELSIQPAIDDNSNIISQGQNCSYFCTSKEIAFDLATSVVIILSSVNIALDSSETGAYNMDWSSLHLGKSLWWEVLFIVCIVSHIIYRTRLSRFSREAFVQISCVCDLLILLAAAVEVFSSGMKWLPLKSGPKSVKVVVDCAKIISACRGLLLFSRISWLKSVGYSFCNVLWNAPNVLAGFGYLWLIYVISSSEAHKLVMLTTEDEKGLAATGLGFNHSDKTPHSNGSLVVQSGFLLIAILLFLFSCGCGIGSFIHKVGNWSEIIKKFAHSIETPRSSSSTQFGAYYVASASHLNKPTEGICVPVLYFVTNHPSFDIIVMTFVILDGIGITLEYLATSERALILRKHYPAYIIFLYLLEIIAKLAGNGLHFFKSNWNIFDTVIIVASQIDFLISLAMHDHYVPVLLLNLRFLRILRIFQFRPFAQRTQLIHEFFTCVSKVNYLLRNFGIFYFSLFLVVTIFRLRCSHFISSHNGFLISAPFQVLNVHSISSTIENLQPGTFFVESAFYFCCLTLFSLIRISVIFSTWLVLEATLCQLLTTREDETELSEINTCHQHQQGMINDSVDFTDKYSYLMPSETIDLETPSSSTANYRVNSNPSGCVDTEEACTTQNSVPNNPLYKTTTITSSEEINGCKVFYVEAMITTV